MALGVFGAVGSIARGAGAIGAVASTCGVEAIDLRWSALVIISDGNGILVAMLVVLVDPVVPGGGGGSDTLAIVALPPLPFCTWHSW